MPVVPTSGEKIMVRWKRLALLAVLAAFGLLAAACSSSSDNSSGNTTTTQGSGGGGGGGSALTIGRILPETGSLAFLGPPQIQGVNLAIADINAAGGVNHQDVKLVTADEGDDAAK